MGTLFDVEAYSFPPAAARAELRLLFLTLHDPKHLSCLTPTWYLCSMNRAISSALFSS
jgi:hypothetical protein